LSIKKFLILVFFITWFNTNDLYAYHPKKGSYIIEINLGIGSHTSDITDDEADLAKDSPFGIVKISPDGSYRDTTELKFASYRIIYSGISFYYHTNKNIATGCGFSNKSISQRADDPEENNNFERQDFINPYLIEPSISYWTKLGNVCFTAQDSFNYGFGKLHRIPTIYHYYRDMGSEDEKEFIEEFHKAIDVSGFGLGSKISLRYFFEFGLITTLSFRYEYLNVSIDDNKFNYMPSSDFHDFSIEIGIGFSTKLGRH